MTYEHPTALNLKTVDPLPEGTQKYFNICAEKLGLVPNVLIAYAHNLEHMQGFTALYNDLMLGESGLSKLEREMIAVAVSSVNRCWYCCVAHGAAVRELSGRPELGEALVINYRVAKLSGRERAMLDFAVKMTEASYKIEEADRELLRVARFSDADIWDVIAVAGFYNMSNRMSSGQ